MAKLPGDSERYLPDEWTLRRLKPILQKLATGRRESGSKELDDGALSLGGEHIGWDGNLKLENPRYISEEAYNELSSGRISENDVLLVKDGATIGKTTIVEHKPAPSCAANEHVFVLRAFPSVLTQKFLYYFIRSNVGQSQIAQEITGAAQEGLNSQFASRVSVPVPPKSEQKKLVRFLDENVARVDSLIDKKERLIELLEERGTALITKAVTKGLDPDIPMKDSGVEWLGEIPEHWDIRELKHCTHPDVPISYGILKPGPDQEDGVPYFGAGEIVNQDLSVDELPQTSSEIAADYPRTKLEHGDVIYAIRGSFGAVAVVPQELEGANLSRDAARIAPARNIVSDWLCWSLQSNKVQAQFEALAIGAAVTGINIRDLREVWLPVPPKSAQRKIASFLNDEVSRIERTVERIEEAISLLKEYRSALITAAVTGKIDVRDHAA